MSRLIYNTTFCVENAEYERFVTWLKDQLIPNMTKSGILASPVLSKVLSVTELGDNGVSLSLQLTAESKESLESWRKNEWPDNEWKITSKYGSKVLYFSTVMEIL